MGIHNLLKATRRLFIPLLIIAAIVFITSGRVQTPTDSVAQQQPVDPPLPKSALELSDSEEEDKLRIVDFQPLSPDRMLVSVNNTIYLLDAKKQIVWETYVDMVAPPVVDSKGGIYGIAFDLAQFSVNARTGDVTYFGRDIAGTHAYHTQIKPYKDAQYLIVENLQFYRDGNRCYPKCPMRNDILHAWRGQRLLWSTDFPPNAELQVWGDKILAVTRKKNSVVVQEIELPASREGLR